TQQESKRCVVVGGACGAGANIGRPQRGVESCCKSANTNVRKIEIVDKARIRVYWFNDAAECQGVPSLGPGQIVTNRRHEDEPILGTDACERRRDPEVGSSKSSSGGAGRGSEDIWRRRSEIGWKFQPGTRHSHSRLVHDG